MKKFYLFNKARQLKVALVLSLIICAYSGMLAQYPLWSVGNKSLGFVSPGGDLNVSSLPVPVPLPGYDDPNFLDYYYYQGQIPAFEQQVMFDQYGNLFFFVIDGRVYDSNGYLIADNDADEDVSCEECLIWNDPGSVIILVPGSCTQFYLVHKQRVIFENRTRVAILDMNLSNPKFGTGSGLKGKLLDESEIEEQFPDVYDEYDIDNFSFYIQNGSSVGYHESYAEFAVYDRPNNGEKIFIERQDGYLFTFNVTQDGIFEVDAEPDTPFTVNHFDYGGDYLNAQMGFGEADISYSDALGGIVYAYTINEDFVTDNNGDKVRLIVHLLSEEGLPVDTWFYDPFDSHSYFDIKDVRGLEFSPDGNFLYFSKNEAPWFGYIDLQASEVNYYDFALTNPVNYVSSQMTGNKYVDGVTDAIYLVGPNGLSALINVNNPAAVQFVQNVPVDNPEGEMVYVTQTDLVTPIYPLMRQNFQGEQIQNFLSTQGCCLTHTNSIGIQGMTINTTIDGTWTYGNNPFGNANAPIRIVDDLIFQTGTVTSITNMVFEFDEDADVIIEKGAKVSLNGTTWTALTCESIMWPGVNLLGTTNAASSIDQLPMTGGDQGYLYMNNSTIEHAIRGVEAGTVGLNAGGIIRAYNSTFRNNQYDVILKKYHYITSGGYYVQNKSTFSNCTFITDAHLNNPVLSPAYHVWLTEVDKINFTNCSFMNKTDINTYNWFVRGRGIYAVKASFTVDGSNDPWTGSPIDPDQTTFYKLRYGISSYGYNNPLAYYTCKQQEFQQCLYGIVNYNTDNVLIYQNNFQLPDAAGFNSDETTERGIYLTNSTGYVVEQNFFDGLDDFQVNDAYPCAMGIWVDNSGDFSNEIRNNDFDELKLGTYVTRNNRYYLFGVDEPGDEDDDGTIDQTGLQLFCNTYTNGQTDVFRDSETLMRQDQGGTQPLPDGFLNAGNRFSAPDCNGAISDFVVDPDNTFYNNYWCHNQPNTVPDCGGTSNVPGVYYGMELLTNSISLETYDNADCPNTYGGPIIIGPNPGVINGLASQLGIVRSQLQSAKNTYLQVVDDNQKQSTLDILSEAFPHESQYYRDLLMQRHPLSSDVIRRLIQQAPRLSSWHLTEIFLANSPLSKELLYEIEQAEILSSFFMSFLYDADSGASLKRLMEMNMLSLATERDQLVQSIARAGLTYESDAESETDQPIYVNEYMAQLDLQSGASALRIRAARLAANGDYTSALALVANEPLLVSYKSILEMEQSVAGEWSLLSTAQISALWDIYNAKKDYSSSMALSILQQIGAADFEPEPRVPIQYRSLQIAKDDENVALPLLGVWPNPATNSAWLHYPIEADEHATIEVYDPQGRLLNSFQPNTNGLVELSLKNYESGIYVVQLIAFDKMMESIKLTVVNQD